MKLYIGNSKTKLGKTVKIISLKFKYLCYKYHFLKCDKITVFFKDYRKELNYNDIVIIDLSKDNKMLKIIKNDIS